MNESMCLIQQVNKSELRFFVARQLVFMKQFIALTIALFFTGLCFSQVDTEPLGSNNYHLAERLEIKSGKLKNQLKLSTKPVSRASLTNYLLYVDTATDILLTDVDMENMERAYQDNNDLVPERFYTESARPIARHFYKTPAHFVDVHNDHFDLHVDPILYGHIGYDKDVNKKHGFINTRGVRIRATIDKKLSLFSQITENQVRYPNFIKELVDSTGTIPGQGFYQDFKSGGGYDYFEPKGYLSFNALKHVNLQFGYDKHFIGDGYRSLFISENSNNYAFLKFNTNVWKINYTNIYAEMAKDGTQGPDTLVGKKYVVMHHLGFDVNDWLNVGLFESIAFGRSDHFEFHYLNPVIFYRAIEQNLGSPDNAIIGLDYSALIKNKFKLYGQLVLDEFKVDELFGGDQSWTNKFGFQQGIKYVDAFGLKNFDAQLEYNRVRPYVYQHNNLRSSFTHYGQPLAHPLGASFSEVIAVGNFQPIQKLRFNGIVSYAKYGRDPDDQSWGSDIVDKRDRPRPFDTGVEVGQGIANKALNVQGRISYEIKPTLVFDIQGVHKTHKNDAAPNVNETYVGASIRWNFRPFDYNY